MISGLGRCGICHRQINEAEPVNSVMLGRPPSAYLCHAACKANEPDPVVYTVDGRGQLEPPHPAPQPSDEVKIVTSLGEFMPEMAGVTVPELSPAMPVKEQKGRPAPAKKAPAKKAPAKAAE